MEELKKQLQLAACDLSMVIDDATADNVDYMDNACCRLSDLIYELQGLYRTLCEKADDMRYGRA